MKIGLEERGYETASQAREWHREVEWFKSCLESNADAISEQTK